MNDSPALTRINDLVVDLGRSLLQYACEAWPWTASKAAGELRELVERVAARQRESVRGLAEFLDATGEPVDFGVYPDEYTSLHYVAIDYLLDLIVQNEEALVAECEEVQRELAGDPLAAPLLEEVTGHERQILAELRSARSR